MQKSNKKDINFCTNWITWDSLYSTKREILIDLIEFLIYAEMHFDAFNINLDGNNFWCEIEISDVIK